LRNGAKQENPWVFVSELKGVISSGDFHPITVKVYRTETKFYWLFYLALKRDPGGVETRTERPWLATGASAKAKQ
jgi:hypothetical protein